MKRACVALLLAWVGGAGFSRTMSAVQPVSVWSGVYTAEQAAAGEKTYYARCSMCHGDDLAGIERAPALAGSQFLDSWNGKDLRRLLDRVLTMPPGDPKPPTTAEAAELLAFVLRTADMPSGSTALPADRAKLVDFTFERQKP
jgi:mono/diheme cytochrome c family protein